MAGTIKVQVLKDEGNKRILKCREGNRIWYQIWITQMDMICIERYFDDCGEVILCFFNLNHILEFKLLLYNIIAPLLSYEYWITISKFFL